VPGKNKRIQATYTDKTYYHGHSITPFILKPKFSNEKEKLFEILGVANSTIVSWFAKYKSSNFSKNVFPKLNPKDIKQLPFPHTTKHDTLLASKVKEVLKNQNRFNILGENFANFLTSQTQAKTLSRKLQNWQELEYNQFIKELNKAIKNFSNEKLSKLQEMEWMEVFETKKEESEKLLYRIKKIDKEIDQMIFSFYGLTEDEIKIVEAD
jgi:hypothetical protein